MPNSILFFGYGNPGRLDDGLGPLCAEEVEKLGLENVTVDSDYQLNVEDAAAVAEHEFVIFADAAVRGEEPFGFNEIAPHREVSFTTHSVEPAAVLALAHEMFGARTRGYALAIRGYEFNEFGERLSARARANLAEAVRFVETLIREKRLQVLAESEPARPIQDCEVVFNISQADLN